ncbi:MAG: hypothetical protein ACT4QG_13570 [Sporichthyaceae bacterium]
MFGGGGLVLVLALIIGGLIDEATSPPSAQEVCYANQSWKQTFTNDQCSNR